MPVLVNANRFERDQSFLDRTTIDHGGTRIGRMSADQTRVNPSFPCLSVFYSSLH
jgi:hypothetical protein